jgi:MFS family permease
VFVPAQAASFATISPAATGRASSLFNAGRQLGGAVGVALLSTVIATIGVVHRVGAGLRPYATAYHWGFLAAAGVALIAVVATWAVSDEEAAPSMRRSTPAETPEGSKQPALA